MILQGFVSSVDNSVYR